jgi:hypothetical protein
MAPADRRVEAQRVFRPEIGIADLEREVPWMRTEEVELFERRIPGSVARD